MELTALRRFSPLNLLCMLCDYDLLSGLSTGWQVVLCLEPHSRFGDIWPFARLDGTGVGLDWDGFGALIDQHPVDENLLSVLDFG